MPLQRPCNPLSRLIAVGLLAVWLGNPVAFALGIVVNEFFATNTAVDSATQMAPDEFIEFLITAPTTAAELASLTFGDTHHNTQRINSAYGFHLPTLESILASAGLTSFLPGSLIVVKGIGLGPQDLSYNPLSASANDDAAWSIQLVAGQGFSQQATYAGGSALDLSTSQGDVVWIAQGTPTNNRDTSGFIDALGVETNNGRIANDVEALFGSSAILNATLGDGVAAVTRGDDLLGTAAGFAVPTLGEPEPTPAGSSSITELRIQSVPEPSRVLLFGLGLVLTALRRRRPKTQTTLDTL
jgi:hypothetical protein